MNAGRRGCWWIALVRLSLAPGWHQLSRLIAAYPLTVYQHRVECPLWLKGFCEPVPSRCQLPMPHAGVWA
jgi:hypothetical protein